jgi:hypothetical protein
MKRLLFTFALSFISLCVFSQATRTYSGFFGSLHDAEPTVSGDSMWISTDNGIVLTSGNLSQSNLIVPNFYATASVRQGNTVWFGGTDSIAMYDGANWSFIKGNGLPSSFSVIDMIVVSNRLWVLTLNNLYLFDNNTFTAQGIRGTSLVAGGSRFAVIVDRPQGTPSGLDDDQSIIEFRNGRFDTLPAPSGFSTVNPTFYPKAVSATYIGNNLFILCDVSRNHALPVKLFRYNRFSNSWVWPSDSVEQAKTKELDHITAFENKLFGFKNNWNDYYEIDPLTLNTIESGIFSEHLVRGAGRPSNFKTKSVFGRMLIVRFAELGSLSNFALEWQLSTRKLSIEAIDLHDFKFPVVSNGKIGSYNIMGNEVTVDGKMVMYSAAPWVYGEINGQPYGRANRYNIRGQNDFFLGPHSDVKDTTYYHRYGRVWKISRAQIENHKNNFGNSNYQMPEVIANWPGNGDHLKGEAFEMAPFVDVNSNGIYEPHLGDYPYIIGDQAVYSIFRDHDNRYLGIGNNPSDSSEVKLEFHQMLYAFDSAAIPDLNHSVFVNYRIFNRGSETLENARFAFFNDFDIGLFYSCLGSDSIENTFMAYGCQSNILQFENRPIAVKAKLLNQPLDGFMYFVNGASTGKPSAMHDPLISFSSSQAVSHYYQYMHYRWRDNAALTRENPSGIGSNSNGIGYLAGQHTPSTQWAFNSADNWYFPPSSLPIDPRGLPITLLGDLAPGDHRCLEFVYTHGYDSTDNSGNWQNGITRAKARLSVAESVYDNLNTGCLGVVLSNDEFESSSEFHSYPNPVRRGAKLNIVSSSTVKRVEMVSMTGTVLPLNVTTTGEGAEVDIPAHTPAGMYIVRMYAQGKGVVVKKVIVE